MTPPAVQLGIGHMLSATPGGPGVIRAFSHDAFGRLEVLIDHGDTTMNRYALADLVGMVFAAADPTRDDAESPLLLELPEAEQAKYRRQQGDLLQVRTGSRSGTPDLDRAAGVLDPAYEPRTTSQEQRIKAKVAELNRTGEAISRSTFFRRIGDFQTNGIDGLIHAGRRLTTSYLSTLNPADVEVIRQVLKTTGCAAKLSNNRLVSVVRGELDRSELGQNLSHYQLKRAVGAASSGLGLHHQAKGRHQHGIKPVRMYGTRPVSRPGEIIQIDATRSNIHVFDPDCGYLPATILTAIDVCSRSVCALRVITGEATARDVGALFWDMMKPMVARSGWPFELQQFHGRPSLVSIVNNPSPELDDRYIGTKPSLYPATIVLDRGSLNNSAELISTATRCGIEIIFAPPGAGYAKGIIEALHNVWDDINSLLPGYKGANVANHPQGIESRALLTARDLQDAIWTCILHEVHNSPHQTLAVELGTARHKKSALLAYSKLTLPMEGLSSYRATLTRIFDFFRPASANSKITGLT